MCFSCEELQREPGQLEEHVAVANDRDLCAAVNSWKVFDWDKGNDLIQTLNWSTVRMDSATLWDDLGLELGVCAKFKKLKLPLSSG